MGVVFTVQAPNLPTEKLDENLMCQHGDAEKPQMVHDNSAYICIHYQV